MVKKKIAFVLAVFCATVLLMAVQKPVFLAYYAADAAQASVGELVYSDAVRRGFRR